MNDIPKSDRLINFAEKGKSADNVKNKKIIVIKKSKDNLPASSTSRNIPNLGWMFYKDYFKNIDFKYVLKENKDIEAENSKILNRKNRKLIEETSLVAINDDLGVKEQSINLEVIYPGLITGVGITHEAGVAGEFKLGLHFDYTNGSPIIHGSSVKGMLRSIFPDFRKGKDKNALSKLDFLIDTIGSKLEKKDPKKVIEQIEAEIFDGIGIDKKQNDIYHRDIFFDAIIIKPDQKGRIVESDALAPHGTNPLKSPNPIPFLKISSGCTIQFRFDVKDGILKADDKIKLFKEIIKTLGIGAKTNVGYGQFEE